jgi:very-short-patch-repair endonuclease
MPYTTTCAHCGASFTTSDHRKKYCNRQCIAAHQSTIFSNKITLICAECGKEYQSKPCLAETSKFCSKKCKSDNRTTVGRVICKCTVCGRDFERLASRVGDCCSYACEGASKRSRVILTCRVCGKSYERITSHAECSAYCSVACKTKEFNATKRRKIGKSGPTLLERAFADVLDEMGILYHTEYKVGRFRLDFFIPSKSVAIELDSVYWHTLPGVKEKDDRRDSFVLQSGIRTIRITDRELKSCADIPALLRSLLE